MRPSHLPPAQASPVMRPKRPGGTTPPITYQIIVRGELSRRYGAVFDGMTLVAENGQTAITGPVLDQTHLHGLLDRVGNLGLELVSVTPLASTSEPAKGT